MGCTIITSLDICEANWVDIDDLLLLILKVKGAPIEGSVKLRLKPGYRWKRTDNIDGSIKFEYEEIEQN